MLRFLYFLTWHVLKPSCYFTKTLLPWDGTHFLWNFFNGGLDTISSFSACELFRRIKMGGKLHKTLYKIFNLVM
jgi:hypothetical protein